MSVPANLFYARSHEWARTEGEVVFVELPDVGTGVDAGEELGTLESVKAVAEFVSPVAGEVTEVNERLADEPNLVNEDPYGEGWLVKISGSVEGENLLGAEAYENFLQEESH